MEEKRKFLFLYLNTGGGHRAPAKVLKDAFHEADEKIEVEMRSVLTRHGFAHFFVEKGYNYALNYFAGAYPLLYDLCEYKIVQDLIKKLFRAEFSLYLVRIIKEEKPTDIVSFHFGLTPYLAELCKKHFPSVRLRVIVTDPFTASTAWFYEKGLKYFVYSEAIRDFAVNKCRVKEENVKTIPFLMNRKYRTVLSSEAKRELKKKLGFSENKKLILLVGGGEGLPGALKIVRECIRERAPFSLAVVAGRNSALKKSLLLLSRLLPSSSLKVYGFIDYLDELVKACDLAVIKAGASTLFEMLYSKKPVIISSYIHNQELGNMRYAVRNKVGYFIQKPRDIYKKITELLAEDDFEENHEKLFTSLDIDVDASKVVKLLLEKE